MDMKTVDLKAEGRMVDPWQQWRECIDRIERECAEENRGMTDWELQNITLLFFAALQCENV